MDESSFGYSDPVSRLLSIGDPRELRRALDWWGGSSWPDYPAEYGLKPENVPDLIRMATDDSLNQAMAHTKEIWAPLHAWRSLGEMKAVEAAEPLLSLFHRIDDEDDDWASDELPEVMELLGPAVVPALAAYLASPKNRLWARVAAATSLEKIGVQYTEARQACVAALTATLEKYAQNDELINGEIIASLAALDAVESAPLVEQAYKADRVDESILGDWEDFQVEVGMLEKRITDPDEGPRINPFPFGNEPYPGKPKTKKEEKKEKSKRKQARASRKKNRKKKK